MQIIKAELLYCPENRMWGYLPEGPIAWGNDGFSWVVIQHAGDLEFGSLNIYRWTEKINRNFQLSGRPGFAFPTDHPDIFVVGIEKCICLVDIRDGSEIPLSDEIDVDVDNTLINDGIAFTQGIVFGAKDLQFATKKAGLYFWRYSDRQLIKLRDDQICSNGKVITGSGDQWCLLDIDTPTKQVVRYAFNTATGTLDPPEIVLDFTAGDLFPDGMVATPDGKSVIVAFYNPEVAEFGVARQFCVETGGLQVEWQTDGAPRVTCPLLLATPAGIKLVLTTATEGMSEEMFSAHPNSGSLFVGETNLQKVVLQYQIPLENLDDQL